MTFPSRRHRYTGRRLAAAFTVATAVAVLTSGVAAADTSQASAQAAQLDLLGTTVLDTGTVNASNDGSGEVVTGDNTPGLGLLATQDVLTAGALAQDATAANDGTSAACAGVTGPGGLIALGNAGDCTETIGTTDGVVVDLDDLDLGDLLGTTLGGFLDLGGLLDLGTITADAVYAECTASSDGSTTGSSTLVDAQLAGLLGSDALPSDPAVNLEVDLALAVDLDPLVRLVLNEQTSSGAGQISVTALHLTVLDDVGGSPVLDLRIGTVTCGPNAQTPPIPAIPAEGLPIAAAGFGVAILGAVAWMVARNRRPAGGPAAG
ncbi:MAG TPA: choice-of-anchor P family protein [Acidimicrobiales bacterium]|jgi:hypothetical protein|nr:choice-of-anchor P family protein [Acidimicrobiales bacterium]